MKKPLKTGLGSCTQQLRNNNTSSLNKPNTTITATAVANMNGPVDNKTVAARYQGSPGGKLTSGGKKKQEPFENSKQESNANVILTSNGANPNHGKGNKVELRNSKNTEGINNSGNVNNMEYANAAWMHDVGSRPHESALTNHDPIITDTNLAEIDFEDFRNEDLAYAFSCGEEESGSSTDMSICRSEVLFSSMRDSIGVGLGMGMHNTGVGLGQADKVGGFGSNINPPGMKEGGINSEKGQFFGGASAGPKLLEEDLASSLILIQDSLINLSFSEQVKVNKNNYTLTFSGHVGVGDQEITESFTQSMSESMERNQQQNNGDGTRNTEGIDMTNGMGELNSPGKLTTWSNLGSGGSSGGARICPTTASKYEQNSYNNNRQHSHIQDEDKYNKEVSEIGSNEQQNSQKGLPLVDAFMRSRNPNSSKDLGRNVNRHSSQDDQSDTENVTQDIATNNSSSQNTIPMMRSKDSVNQYLKNTATIAKQLTSIDEKSSDGSSDDVSSIANAEDPYKRANNFGPMLRTQPSGQSTSPSTPSEGRMAHDIEPEKSKHDKIQRKRSSWAHNRRDITSAYPDLGFLENDVGLWDAFFLHGKNSRSHRSVLKPPVPVEEYLREQKERQLQVQTVDNQFVIRTMKHANGAGDSSQTQQPGLWHQPQQPSIRDLDSLRTLLPQAHKHLLGATPSTSTNSEPSILHSKRDGPKTDTRLPVAKIRPMTAGPSSSFSRQNHDLQNQAIKSLFAQNPKIPSCPRILPSTVVEPKEGSTQIVKVREAWAPFPEEAAKVTDGVVRRVQRERSGLRRFSEHSSRDDAESDAINNNGNDGEEDQCNAEAYQDEITSKRRSYHPQEYLSQVLQQEPQRFLSNQSQKSRHNDFPKNMNTSLPIPNICIFDINSNNKKLRSKSVTPKSGRAHKSDHDSFYKNVLKKQFLTRDSQESGSQNDLCDSWTGEEGEECKQYTGNSGHSNQAVPQRGDVANPVQLQYHQPKAAEYPFQSNLCMPPQGVNFDLTHKRALFVTLYTAIERLLACADESESSSESALARCVLLRDLCPALHAIMSDGMKPEVITSFGRMPTSVWQVVEAVTRQGSNSTGTASSDLIMLLNTRYGSSGSLQSTTPTSVSTPLSSSNFDQDQRKFAGFVTGMIKMSCLHIWFSKLKWSMDVLLRFYERHAFICALHKETRLLFDELIFCLQRLYSVPSTLRIDLPFGTDSDFTLDDVYNHPIGHAIGMTPQSHNSRTPTTTFASSPASSDGLMSRSGGFAPFTSGCPYGTHNPHNYHVSHTPTSNCCHSNCGSCNTSHCCERPSSGFSASGGPNNTDRTTTRRASMTRSRIPRPISLPKKLEAKLNSNFNASGISPSPTRAGGPSSRSRGRSSGNGNEQSSRASSAKSPGAKPPIAPTLSNGGGKSTGSGRPKSLVRDTIRLFDARSRNRVPLGTGAVVATGRQPTTTNRSDSAVQRRKTSSARKERPKSSVIQSTTIKSPKTGGGESLAHPGYDRDIPTTKST